MKRIIILVVLVVTVVLAVIRIMDKEDVGGVTIVYDGKEETVDFEGLDQRSFSGTLVNGKGESSQHSFRGALLADVLYNAGFSLDMVTKVRVIGADSYSAELSVSEIKENGRVWLAVEDNGTRITGLDGTQGVQLIVFFEDDSRRCVRAAEFIELY